MITGRNNSGKTILKIFATAIAAVVAVILVFEGVRALKGSNGELTVTVYDVGKGDCILVQQGGYAMMIDCGYEGTAQEIIDNLRSAKVNIEAVVITHYDKDHVGGAAAFADSFEDAAYYLPDYEGSSSYYKDLMSSLCDAASSHDVAVVRSDLSFELGDALVDIYASGIEYDGENDNDCSLVISVLYDKDSYLFAGDLEKEGIEAFLAKHPGQWDVIKMPHHGNKKGNVDKLLDAVQPRLAIITDSDSDPAAESVLKLLENAGSNIYRMSLMGTLSIKSNGSRRYAVAPAI